MNFKNMMSVGRVSW